MGEVFGVDQAVGFGCIWLALAVYAADGWQRARRARKSSEAMRCDENIPPCDGATPAFEEAVGTGPDRRA
jgi:chloramphenicol-sensitive protein RarD